MSKDIRKEFSDVIYPTMVIRSQAETIELQDKEIERLNNIINELEIYLKKHYEEWKNSEDTMLYSSSQEDKEILDLLEYLKYKGSDKE